MFSSLAAVAAHPVGWGWGWGPGPWFLFIPFFWLGVIALCIVFGGRRRRAYWAENGGWGPQGRGTQSARAVLAERYARGELDEAEYRARLEVLLATAPQPRD
ncbi:SHOCT domain-containing protein [Cellulomonas sp. URHD0024]|uniref:SHOCT domain-containing protein n=1 Tax=Cellulomonas sp. URHD0024 TaxID=1302620 RepID=UPI00041DE75E|nr:SHOCT domain-containing protein [Cellulomonas sp. URHD0024]